jgi:hypothetical protein
MKGKDLVIVGAAVFVLYKLAQVKPVNGSGQYLTNMPVLGAPIVNQPSDNITLINARDGGGGGGYIGGASYNGDYGYQGTQDFVDWLYSLPVGSAGSNDPKFKPSVISVNDL